MAEMYFNLNSKFSSKSNSKLFHPSLVYQNRKTRSFAERLSRIILTRALNTHFKLCILHTASITPTYTVKFMPVCRFGQRVVRRKITERANYTRRARLGGHARGASKITVQYYRVSRECVFLQLCYLLPKLETTRNAYAVCVVDPGGAISIKIFMIFFLIYLYFNQMCFCLMRAYFYINE